jgi:NitT/TauT family transport system ATP-binding protein
MRRDDMNPAEAAVQTDALIALSQAGKTFAIRGRSHVALLPVDLEIRRREIVVLLGPSGCGKSTVLNLVAGLMRPTTGTVRYDGIDVDGPNLRVGYMTQTDTLLPWRTVADNVRMPLELACRSTTAGDRDGAVRAMLELVGLADFGKHYPAELSGGMRKRAALARMLIYRPETLLLDEPFGALDAQLKIVMQQELLRLAERLGTTVVFVTHDLAEAIALGDRIVVFGGRPGGVRSVHRSPFERPRDPLRLRFEPAFAELHERLWAELDVTPTP